MCVGISLRASCGHQPPFLEPLNDQVGQLHRVTARTEQKVGVGSGGGGGAPIHLGTVDCRRCGRGHAGLAVERHGLVLGNSDVHRMLQNDWHLTTHPDNKICNKVWNKLMEVNRQRSFQSEGLFMVRHHYTEQ